MLMTLVLLLTVQIVAPSTILDQPVRRRGVDASVRIENAPALIEQAQVDALWEYVQTLVGKRATPPVVYFPAEPDPCESQGFMAFYYEYSPVIRISAAAVGRDRPQLGYTYFLIGHEMSHYSLSGRVPVGEQHCYIRQAGYHAALRDWLVTRKLAHPMLLYLFPWSGCGGD